MKYVACVYRKKLKKKIVNILPKSTILLKSLKGTCIKDVRRLWAILDIPGPTYSRVHKSSDSFFSKILEKPSIVQKKNDTSYIRAAFFNEMKQKKNSKWPT